MIFDVLKNRNFTKYFVADIISGFGTGMSFIGANWYILEKTGRNELVGIVMAITITSGLIASFFTGTFTDKYDRLKILVWSNAGRGFLIFAIAGLLFFGGFNLFYIYIFAAVGGIGWNFYIPSSRALVQEILTEAEMPHGNAVLEISMQVGMFTAAAASGFIFKYLGFIPILVIDATTFLISNFVLSKVNYSSIIHKQEHSPYLEQLKDGIKYLLSNKGLFIFGAIMALPMVATFTSNVILPGYVSEHLNEDSVVFGIADMSFGIGALLSGFFIAKIVARLNKTRSVFILFFISLIINTLMVFNTEKAYLFVTEFLFGFCSSAGKIIINTYLMENVKKEFFGRCMSVWMAIMQILEIISVYCLGLLMDRTAANYGFYWLAGIFLIAILFFAASIQNKMSISSSVEY